MIIEPPIGSCIADGGFLRLDRTGARSLTRKKIYPTCGVNMAPDKTLLTIEEFAQRMRIKRSTAYTWLAAGRLETGRHVLRIGGVVRIVWCDDLLDHLLKQSVAESARPALVRRGKGGRNRCALNADYLQVD